MVYYLKICTYLLKIAKGSIKSLHKDSNCTDFELIIGNCSMCYDKNNVLSKLYHKKSRDRKKN